MLQEGGEHHTPSARDYAIFQLYFHFGMSANAIARVSRFHLTSKGSREFAAPHSGHTEEDCWREQSGIANPI